MKKILRMLGFTLLGSLMMVALLAWVAQFFNRDFEHTPVIWLSTEKSQDAARD